MPLLALLLLFTSTIVIPLVSPSLSQRNIISPSDLRPSYDYIIPGGGLAGLVLASRLSEDSSVSVLVLEAGASGDDPEDRARINTPSGAYFTSIVGTQYDWAHRTVPQGNMGGRVIGWPRGKVLGGSTAMNAMYLVGPSSVEIDAWAELLGSMDDDGSGMSSSTFQSMHAAMRKSEIFVPPLTQPQRVGNIQYETGNYGSGGPMSVSYPAVQMSITGNWTSTLLSALGIPPLTSPNGGTALGGYISPSSINPSNWTRSSSRSCIDALSPRDNLHIMTNAHVTRIVFSDSRSSNGEVVATGIEFAERREGERKVVNVSREIILASGPIGSPRILLLSGVGPKDVLESAGVGVVEELGGVGGFLQDHVTSGITWRANFETAGDIHASRSEFSRTPEFLSTLINAIAFLNLSTLFSHSPSSLSTFTSQLPSGDTSTSLVPSSYSEVREGYKVLYKLHLEKILSDPGVPQLELLMSVVGEGVVGIQAALQHPFRLDSMGRIYINSSNPFDEPVIDPGYLSHSADIILMRQGMKLIRRLGEAFQDLELFGDEVYPGERVQSDTQWESWAGTQYHPIGSCAMLPLHGLANVRVIDSSVYPFEFAAHVCLSSPFPSFTFIYFISHFPISYKRNETRY
ncbi:hypothetical protein BDQ17DRAFT_1379062 [Cyathus striatus]|nr:hypothetical protein BDQ17DRAFT_1379062 [Cyathus striatus]